MTDRPTTEEARRTDEELAVRAALSLLWRVLQPYHFLIGVYVGTFIGVAVIALAVAL